LHKIRLEELNLEATLRLFGSRGDETPAATCLKLFEVAPDAAPDPAAKLVQSARAAVKKDRRLGLLAPAHSGGAARSGGAEAGGRNRRRGGQRYARNTFSAQRSVTSGHTGSKGRSVSQSTRAKGAGADA
jgi:hypothetical protein